MTLQEIYFVGLSPEFSDRPDRGRLDAFVTFESAWIYPNTFLSIVDSFMEVIGTAGHIHMDRKRESMEISTAEKFSYPKGFLNLELFGRMHGAFPSCLEDFLYAILDDTTPRVTGLDGRQVTAALGAIHQSLESGVTERISQPNHTGPPSDGQR